MNFGLVASRRRIGDRGTATKFGLVAARHAALLRPFSGCGGGKGGVVIESSSGGGGGGGAGAPAKPPHRSGRSQEPTKQQQVSENLAGIKHIIAVSSCKGGVGKSTVSVNLACALAASGHRVGLLDADVFGPSLPTMLTPESLAVKLCAQRKHVVPLQIDMTPDHHYHAGGGGGGDDAAAAAAAAAVAAPPPPLKAISYGWVGPNAGPGAGGKGAAIMRGPMVSRVATQLALGTAWGELDYLLVDMPPGTGDIQLSLCQSLHFSAAVIVTTPQKLAYVDVVKGIEMFEKLEVPAVAVVENMSYFDCDLGTRYRPFGDGFLEQLEVLAAHKSGEEAAPEPAAAAAAAAAAGAAGAAGGEAGSGIAGDVIGGGFRLPISAAVSEGSDGGRPIVLAAEAGDEVAGTYHRLAAAVADGVDAIAAKNSRPDVSFDPTRQAVVATYAATAEAGAGGEEEAPLELLIHPAVLRRNCRCAAAVDEVTNEQLLLPEHVPDNVEPMRIVPKGNYAFGVDWTMFRRAKGTTPPCAQCIYPYSRLKEIAANAHKFQI